MPTMYELTDSYQRLLEAAESLDSDVFEDTLQSIRDSIEDKAQGYAAVIAELQGEVEKRKKEKERITNQLATLENHIRRMKDNLFHAMETAGVQKVKGRYTVSVRNNAPHVVIEDESKVSWLYVKKVERKLDNQGILKALKAGEEVSGARLEQNKSIQIR